MEPEAESCPQEDQILDFAIEYKQSGTYPPALTKEKKRAVRKRAATLIADNGEIYVERKNRRVKVISSAGEQARILRACHSDPTSGHFGTTKTWRRVAKRLYWRGIANITCCTIGILNKARNLWEAFQGFILHVHVEGDIISPRYDRTFDIHFRLRDMAEFVPHTLLWGILNNASSPINTYIVRLQSGVD